MSLKQKISEDMKDAMRAKDDLRLSTIRMLMAAIKQKEIDERIELDDTKIVAIVNKLVKQRQDSVAQFQQAGRHDLAERESNEIQVLTAYMPEQLSPAAIDQAIERAITESGAQNIQEIGKVMSLLKQTLAGQADMAQVSARLKTKLSA